jgi:hypothetical protein
MRLGLGAAKACHIPAHGLRDPLIFRGAENLSEKNRKELIKRAQAGGVWEKVEYRLDE